MMINRCAWFVLVLLLAGCVTSPPVDYYTLLPMSTSNAAAPPGAIVIGLGPLEVPGYLDRPQLVTQGAQGRVKVDEFNHWAEPLAEALPRVLTANVDELLDEAVVVRFPYGARIRADYRLAGRIVRFDADLSGMAVLEVQWGVQDAQANHVLALRRTRYTAQASGARNPGAVVAALNETVAAFSRDIASQLSQLVDSG
jgi:uncharacterized lipoprotein YmbA